jgi:hypothetical protein
MMRSEEERRSRRRRRRKGRGWSTSTWLNWHFESGSQEQGRGLDWLATKLLLERCEVDVQGMGLGEAG